MTASDNPVGKRSFLFMNTSTAEVGSETITIKGGFNISAVIVKVSLPDAGLIPVVEVVASSHDCTRVGDSPSPVASFTFDPETEAVGAIYDNDGLLGADYISPALRRLLAKLQARAESYGMRVPDSHGHDAFQCVARIAFRWTPGWRLR